MADFLDLDGGNGNFDQEMIRQLPERYTFLDGLETVFEQNWLELGAYRPHRFSPTLYHTKDIQEGFTIHHGQIVSGINQKSGTGAWNSLSGIDTTGFFPHAIGFGGVLKDDVNSIYGYDRTLDGFIVPCNGTNATVNDRVSASDVEIERMLANGNIASSADVGTTIALARPGDQAPLGVVAQIMRETAGANLSYRLWTQAWSVIRYGILHVPYTLADPSRIAVTGKADSAYAAVSNKHQFILVDDPNLLKHEAVVRVDGDGKMVLSSDATTYKRTFGKVMSWTNETYTDLATKVDAFPGHESQGTTTTGGLTRRLYEFVKLVRKAQGNPVTIGDIKSDVDAGYYGMAKVIFNTMTV